MSSGSMITLSVSNDGVAYVWNADEWLDLRENHRIVGQLVGILANLPIQDSYSGLPMALLPEEATLLVDRKVARLARFPSLSRCPGEGVLSEYRKHRDKTFEDQNKEMKEERKRTLTGIVDKIIEGRRCKQMGLKTKKKQLKKNSKFSKEQDESTSVEKDALPPITDSEREAVMLEEMSKIPQLSKEHALVQTFSVYPWLRPEDACPVEWTFPSNARENTRYLAFKDLWEKGHYITCGEKFGGDFLVYPGDPVQFHSQFIVVCVDHRTNITAQQLVTYGRIGSSVRKTVVLASLPENSMQIVYQSIKWAGSHVPIAF